MTNDKAFYRWTKVINGIGSFAVVTLDVHLNNNNQNEIIEQYTGKGFTGQGNIEEVPPQGYDSWKAAARNGLEYAFSLIDSFWTVNIIKIEGRSFTDTNPTIVGYAVIRAFLDKINFKLDPKHIDKLEEFVLSSWTKPYKELIPDFANLTFTEYAHNK